MEPLVVPLRSRRLKRALTAQKLNHAIPAIGLVATGLDGLRHGAHGFELALAGVEIVMSVLLLGSLARAIRSARTGAASSHPHEHTVDWVDIWAAGVLFAEAGERWHLRHHIARPIILTALVTLALGLSHGRMIRFGRRRRAVRLSDDGIYVGGKPFMRFTSRWKDISAIAIGERFAEIRTRDGRVRQLNLSDLENAAEVRRALEEGQRRVEAATPAEQSPSRPPAPRAT